jgi:hypothetical protein
MEMNRLVYKTSAVLLLGILLNACWKPKYDNEYISQEAKDYCMFEEGSYWIYQDSVTSNLDSVILTKTLLEYQEKEWEMNYHTITECYKSDYYHYLSDTSIILYNGIYATSPAGISIIAFNFGIQDLEKNMILGISAIDSHTQTSYLPSYSIEENNFDNVRIVWQKYPIRHPGAYYTTDYYIRSYWVKNIGLIRYEIYNPNNEILNTYNLIKYNVKPYNVFWK